MFFFFSFHEGFVVTKYLGSALETNPSSIDPSCRAAAKNKWAARNADGARGISQSVRPRSSHGRTKKRGD